MWNIGISCFLVKTYLDNRIIGSFCQEAMVLAEPHIQGLTCLELFEKHKLENPSLAECGKYFWWKQIFLPARKYSRFSVPDFGWKGREYGRI